MSRQQVNKNDMQQDEHEIVTVERINSFKEDGGDGNGLGDQLRIPTQKTVERVVKSDDSEDDDCL